MTCTRSEKGNIKRYLMKLTGYSRSQLTHLILYMAKTNSASPALRASAPSVKNDAMSSIIEVSIATIASMIVATSSPN